MQKITNYILAIAGALAFSAAFLVVLDTTAARMDAIEQTQNCRYDYNDLCYTEAERPWLFNN